MSRLLKRIVQNPYLNLLVGVAVLVSGITESIQQFSTEGLVLGAHHGVVALGLLHTLKSLSDVFEGLERFEGVQAELQ